MLETTLVMIKGWKDEEVNLFLTNSEGEMCVEYLRDCGLKKV